MVEFGHDGTDEGKGEGKCKGKEIDGIVGIDGIVDMDDDMDDAIDGILEERLRLL